MDNFFIQLLNEHGVKNEIIGNEVWYQCPIPGHNNDDKNFSASYSIPKNKCNCFVHGGGIHTLLMYLTNKTYKEVNEILEVNKPSIELNIAEFECQMMLEDHVAPYISKTLLKKYKNKIHKKYTFENFTSNIKLIKKLEIGFDEESKRVTIPVKDENGQYALVVKRSISLKPKLRYLYEPKGCEKSDFVYGLNFWKDPEYLIVVEGVKDAIKCIDKGIKNVVAILGSKPSERQIYLLSQKTNKIYIALDDDFAGNLGVKKFKYNCFKFSNGLYLFKHPNITEEEIRLNKRRDMADYSREEIIRGIKESKEYQLGLEDLCNV